jgi:hypothetical protein
LGIDWDYVKKTTLWHYEELLEKILHVLDYGFVQKYYSHSMAEAAAYSAKIQQGYRINGRETAYIGNVIALFIILNSLGVRNYRDLAQELVTRAKCEAFVKRTGVSFEALIQMLNFLFRWVLPFKCPIKELLQADDAVNKNYLEILRRHKISSNLDVIQNCTSKEDRAHLTRETGVTETFILDLTHRADISRLAYVRGKAINHLCKGGYHTLQKIADADLHRMESDMAAYYKTIGKSYSDFKAVIPLDRMIGGARVLPRIIEG